MPARSIAVHGFFLCLLVSILAGCAPKVVEPEPTRIIATIEASPELNPDATGRPSPVVSRLYELRSLGAFNSADFFSLYEDDAALLGQDMLGREEMRLTPGEKRKFRRELNPQTRYLGVIAAYRDLENARWRTAIEVPAHATTVLTIQLERLAVTLAKR